MLAATDDRRPGTAKAVVAASTTTVVTTAGMTVSADSSRARATAPVGTRRRADGIVAIAVDVADTSEKSSINTIEKGSNNRMDQMSSTRTDLRINNSSSPMDLWSKSNNSSSLMDPSSKPRRTVTMSMGLTSSGRTRLATSVAMTDAEDGAGARSRFQRIGRTWPRWATSSATRASCP